MRGTSFWASLGLHGLVLGGLAFVHVLGTDPGREPGGVRVELRPDPEVQVAVLAATEELPLVEPEADPAEPTLVEQFVLDPPLPELSPRPVDFTPPTLADELFPPTPDPEPAVATEDTTEPEPETVVEPTSPADPASPQPVATPVTEPRPEATPPPTYPRASRRAGEQGDVHLRLRIGPGGAVLGVTVLRSSGHRRLDEAAREALLTWRFDTASGAAERTFEHTVTFRLSD